MNSMIWIHPLWARHLVQRASIRRIPLVLMKNGRCYPDPLTKQNYKRVFRLRLAVG